jgi:hypothetical protein
MADTDGHRAAGGAIRAARELVADVVGRPPESISGVARAGDGGWTVSVDVVEMSRIPPSTDLMATYDVTVDDHGDLVDLVRARRFLRSQVTEE